MIRLRVQGVMFNRDGKLLLVKHRKGGKEYYVLPGGGVEYGESLVNALARELKEELNIRKIFSAKFLGINEFIDGESNRHIIDLYYYVIADLEEIRIVESDGIIVEFDFFHLSEIDKITVYPSSSFVRGLVEKSLGEVIELRV
ncbi:MAG: NUDIX hydrolase [Brevinematia bacterium]